MAHNDLAYKGIDEKKPLLKVKPTPLLQQVRQQCVNSILYLFVCKFLVGGYFKVALKFGNPFFQSLAFGSKVKFHLRGFGDGSVGEDIKGFLSVTPRLVNELLNLLASVSLRLLLQG